MGGEKYDRVKGNHRRTSRTSGNKKESERPLLPSHSFSSRPVSVSGRMTWIHVAVTERKTTVKYKRNVRVKGFHFQIT